MSDRDWQGEGPEFTLHWGGRSWTLNLAEPNPGLRPKGGVSSNRFLGLRDLAQVGRSSPDVFNPSTLVGFERHQGRIQVLYEPPGWGGVFLRASWSPMLNSDGVDLEVQIGATSVGELRAVEVGVETDCRGESGVSSTPETTWLEPRDAMSAASSYDGRESLSTLRGLWTLPLPESSTAGLPPWIQAPPDSVSGRCYVELVQPADVARRIAYGTAGPKLSDRRIRSMRYALFGHDLEKGVILRARLRGHWIKSSMPERDSMALLANFLGEPLPLGP